MAEGLIRKRRRGRPVVESLRRGQNRTVASGVPDCDSAAEGRAMIRPSRNLS